MAEEERMTTEYVVGFLCDKEHGTVVLIEKQRPAWQKGKLNGAGGPIEPGETPLAAMRREFWEKTGLNVGDWELAVEMFRPTCRVYFFIAVGHVSRTYTRTDEKVRLARIDFLPREVLPNLRWLIPLCLDSDIEKPVGIHDTTEPAEKPKTPRSG